MLEKKNSGFGTECFITYISYKMENIPLPCCANVKVNMIFSILMLHYTWTIIYQNLAKK